MLQYPKPIMSVTELVNMGFSREYIYKMAHRKGQKYCVRLEGFKTKLFFDTVEFEKARQKQTERVNR